jgi:DNA-binding beta-propeller fold protein YncE
MTSIRQKRLELVFWSALLAVGLVLMFGAARSETTASPQPAATSPLAGSKGELPAPPAGLLSHRVVATIPLTPGIGMNPVAIAADPHSALVYVVNDGSADITVLSGTAALGMVAGLAEAGRMSYSLLGVHPTNGLAYAVERIPNCLPDAYHYDLQVISATRVITTIPVVGCYWHHGGGCDVTAMAFQPATGYVYLAHYSGIAFEPPWGAIAILDATSPITEVAITGAYPTSVAADPQRGWVYVSAQFAYTGSVYVLSGTSVVGTVPITEPGKLVVQPVTGLAYVQAQGGQLAVLSGTAALGEIPIGEIADMAVDESRGYLYVSHPATPTITIVSGTAVLTQVAVISPATRIEVAPATGLVYLRHARAPFITVLSGTTVLTEVQVLGGNAAIEVAPYTGLTYAVSGEREVTVLQGIHPWMILPAAAPQPRAMEMNPRTGQVALLSSPPTLSFVKDEAIVATTPLTAAPREMVIAPESGLIYLALYERQAVLVMSGTALLATVHLGDLPTDIAVQPGTGLVYVPGLDGILSVLSGTERIAALTLTRNLSHVAVDLQRGPVYVTGRFANAVYVLSATDVLTTIYVPYQPDELAVEPRSGYLYVTVQDGITILSGTEVLTTIRGVANPIEMQASLASGYVYVHADTQGPPCQYVRVIYGLENMGDWFNGEGKQFSCLEPDPVRSYVYVGHADYGGSLSVGIGASLVEALNVGSGSGVRAVAVDPAGERVYVATDHEIVILEAELPYRFYLPLLRRQAFAEVKR